MKKKKITILINIITIFLEIIGLFLSIKENNRLLIEYFTIDSNILAIISSIFYLYDSKRYKRKITEVTKILKYTTCVSLILTMIMVFFILLPLNHFNTNLLFKGAMPIHHIICPLLVLISFTKFENYKFDWNDKYQALIFTSLYGLVLVILNIVGIVIGPYPFLLVKQNSIVVSLFSLIGITIVTFSISTFLQKIKKRH